LTTDSNYDTENKGYLYDIGHGETEGVKPNLHVIKLNLTATEDNLALLKQALSDIAAGKDISQTILGTVDMGYESLDDVSIKSVDGKAVFYSVGKGGTKSAGTTLGEQGFSIPSYNAVEVGTSVPAKTSFSESVSSFITSNDIFVAENNADSSGSASNIVTVAQLVNKCVSRCIASGTEKSVCTKECNRPRCGCRDTDGNGVIEAVCEAGQFGKECLGVASCNIRVCDNPDLLKNSVWTETAANINTNANNTQSAPSAALTPDSSINVVTPQGTCPPEMCADSFYAGGWLSNLKCPGTQYCNKYWCKGNCLSSCGTNGDDPYGMCPDAGKICCKPASSSSSQTLSQIAADSCPAIYCKPACDSLRENDTGHKSCNGFKCCMPNYNIGTCSSLGGECVGGCESTKILGRDATLCLQGGICCQKGTGSKIVSYCGCENGQPKCGSQMPNGLQCSTDSQCASLLKCD